MAASTKDPPPPSANVPVPDLSDQGYAQSFGARVPLPAAQPSPAPTPTPVAKDNSDSSDADYSAYATPVDRSPPDLKAQADAFKKQQKLGQGAGAQPGTNQPKELGEPPKEDPRYEAVATPVEKEQPKQPDDKAYEEFATPVDKSGQPVAVPTPTPQGPTTTEQPPQAAGQPQPNVSPSSPANLPAQPQPVQQPQAQPRLTIPTPTPESTAPDPHELQQVLIAQGYSPGEAQARANGQQPKTLNGNAPAPKPAPAPTSPPEQQPESMEAAQARYEAERAKLQQPAPTKPTAGITPKAAAFNVDTGQWDLIMPDGSKQHLPLDAYSGTGPIPGTPSSTTTDQPKTVQGGNIKGTATSFGLNYDGSIDQDDNGRGIFGANTRDPKLKGVAVPVDVLEATFGHAFQKNADGTYSMLNTPEAQKVIQAIKAAHVEALGLDGKVHKFSIVDIQGSLGRHPGKVLDLTPAAGRELGFNDNHSVSYQIAGPDGKIYEIDPDKLAAWNKGGGDTDTGSGKGSKGGDQDSKNPFAGQPLFSVGSVGGGGSSPPLAPPAPHFGGGDGQSYREAPDQSGGGSIYLGPFGGGRGGGGGGQAAQAAQTGVQTVAQAPPDDQGQQNPLVTALMQRGFTQQQAQQLAQGMANVAPGKGIGPLNRQPPPPAPSPITPIQLALSSKQPVTPQLLSAKQLMPGKGAKGAPPAAPSAQAKAPLQLNAPPVAPSAPKQQQPQAPQQPVRAPISPIPKRTPGAPAQPTQPATPPAKPQPAPLQQPTPKSPEPTAFTGRPTGSTHGDPNPPGMDTLTGPIKDQGKQHKALLSPDDPRVSKQPDGYIKGEHFVEGDPFHDNLLNGLPGGKQGRQRQLLGETEQAIADKRAMHISYLSSPKEAEKFPTRDSRKFQYDKHSPEARLMGTTEGQLVGHSLIPLNVGVKLSKKGNEPHESYLQGISTNVLANNFQHVNDKLAAMGRTTPYKELGTKFSNDLEGYYHNLNAGHTATGRGYAIGTEDHPNEPDREHVPYKLSRKEADFIGTVINNTGAFAKHEDAKKIRELARANGTLVTEKGETNRMRHDIEEHEPGWRERVLEPSIRTFKTGLIMAHHPAEEHLGEAIRPGKDYQSLTKALQRTSERGRPDIPIAASLHHTFADNKKINEIERDFSDHKIDEPSAREQLKALGEDPDEYRFVGGSGGLITPYEDDPEALTPEEHTTMKNNLRQAWVGGKMNVEDYRKKSAEVPLPSKPSQPAAPKPLVEPEAPKSPAPTPTPKPVPKPQPPPSDTEPEETPTPVPKAPKAPKPKPVPKAPPEPVTEPEEAPEPAAIKPPAPDEPLPTIKAIKPVAVKPPVTAPAKLPKLVKPKDAKGEWKGVPEEHKQAYLEEKVRRTMANQIRDKATHKLEVQRNEQGGVKYDPNGSPVYVQHDYDIANSPMLKKKALNQIKGADEHEDTIDPEQHKHLNQIERRRLSAMRAKSAVHTMGDKIFDSYNEAIKNPDIAAGEGWYSRMRKRLGDALGEHHELFAQLLGATSAKTPVRTNFINALDAYEQWKEGMKDPTNMNLGFNKHIAKFLEAHGKLQEGEGALTQHMRDTGILKKGDPDHESDADAMAHWIDHHKILPLKKTGSKYSANSNAVLKVLAGTWLKEVGAPKTPNFAGNLTGRTLEATIDVWAARHLQRLGYEGHGKGPWRAQSAAEPGVSNMDFAFSQDAMRHAADRISKETGKQLNPDDLQAILWFAEKHHYEDRGWTRGQGAEKSSFDEVADKVFGKDGQPHDKPMDSTQLQAHYAAEAKALRQRKDKIETAQSYLGTPKEQTHLPKYMEKHGLTHEEIHGAPEEEEEEAA